MISIIIPVFNEAKTLPKFICRLDASVKDGEVIIVDGQSLDETMALARKQASPDVIIMQSGRGRARQMNSGAALAHGDILLFLHADTILPLGALADIEKTLVDPDVVGGRFRIELDNQKLRYRLIGAMINIRDAMFGGFTGDQAIFVRKKDFLSLGGFNEIEICEDLDFAARMQKAGKVVQLPAKVITSARRWEKDGWAKTIILMWIIRIMFYLRISPKSISQLYADTR